MCRQARVDYEREIQHNTELHQAIVAEKAQQKYEKHYNLCKDVSQSFSFLISYRLCWSHYLNAFTQKLVGRFFLTRLHFSILVNFKKQLSVPSIKMQTNQTYSFLFDIVR